MSPSLPAARARTGPPPALIAQRWLQAVDAQDLADRRPAQLSGGQAQRVAVARALAAEPQVLLLDEPMSALDVTAAPALRRLLRHILRDDGRTALMVTHDLLDALAVADRVIIVEGGRIVESGPVRTVLTSPRSAFAARIAGVNLIAGVVTGPGTLQTPWGQPCWAPAMYPSVLPRSPCFSPAPSRCTSTRRMGVPATCSR